MMLEHPLSHYWTSPLKKLFNIVEDWFNFFLSLISVLYNDVQKGQQTARNAKVSNWCSDYQEIYDWISPLNLQSG